MQEEVNKAIARRYYDEIVNRGNLQTIDKLISPNFIFTIPTHPETSYGFEGFRQIITMLHGAFPDVHLKIEHLIAEGDTVVGHWIESGTHTGSPFHTVMGDIPPTGKRFIIDGISWLRIVNGKIVEFLANEDTLGLLQQLGVLPSKSVPISSSVEENKAIVTRYFNEILNQGKLDVIDEIIAPNFTLRISSLHKPFRGSDGMKQFVTGLRAAFPDIKFTVERQIAEKDQVATRFTSISSHQGEFQGIPPTGRSIKDQGVDIFRIADGKIVEVWVNENAFGLMQQLGVIPSSK